MCPKETRVVRFVSFLPSSTQLTCTKSSFKVRDKLCKFLGGLTISKWQQTNTDDKKQCNRSIQFPRSLVIYSVILQWLLLLMTLFTQSLYENASTPISSSAAKIRPTDTENWKKILCMYNSIFFPFHTFSNSTFKYSQEIVTN